MAKKTSVKNTKSNSFKAKIETINTNIHEQLSDLGVSAKEINDVVTRIACVQNPSRKKSQEELDWEELDDFGVPGIYSKLSDKVKALYHLRCKTSPTYGSSVLKRTTLLWSSNFMLTWKCFLMLVRTIS